MQIILANNLLIMDDHVYVFMETSYIIITPWKIFLQTVS